MALECSDHMLILLVASYSRHGRWPSVEPHKSEKYRPPPHQHKKEPKKQTGTATRTLTAKLLWGNWEPEYFSDPYPVHHRLQNTSCVWLRNEYQNLPQQNSTEQCLSMHPDFNLLGISDAEPSLIPRRLKSGCMDKHCSVEFCCGRFWLLDKEIYAGIGIGWSMTASGMGIVCKKANFHSSETTFCGGKNVSGERNGVPLPPPKKYWF